MKKYAMVLFMLLFAVTVSAETIQINSAALTSVSNTSQCFNCEAWVEVDLYTAANTIILPLVPNTLYNLKILKERKSTEGLKDYGIEVWQKEIVVIQDYCSIEKLTQILKPDFDLNGETCLSLGCIDGKIQGNCDCVSTIQEKCGTHEETKLEKVSDHFFGFTIEKGQKYLLRIWGTKKAVLRSNTVDWVLTFDGREIKEWEYWNSDWAIKFLINDMVVDVELAATDWIRLQGLDFSALSSECADAADITVVNETTQTEVTELNFQNWDGTNTDPDVDVLFKVTELLPADTYDGEYAIYSENDGCTPKTNYVTKTYDNFEDGTINRWTEVSTAGGSFTASETSKKFGDYGGLMSTNGVDSGGDIGFTNSESSGDTGNFYFWGKISDVAGQLIFAVRTSGHQGIAQFAISAGEFSYYDGSYKTDWTATPANDTWYRFRIDIDNSGGGNVDYYLYDAAGNFIESKLGSTPGTTVDIGYISIQTSDLALSVETISWDDITYVDTEEPARVSTYTLGAGETLDEESPVIGLITLNGFITTDTNSIRGTGYFYATATDNVGVVSCEYTLNGTDWIAAAFDETYCISDTFTITDKTLYSFNFTAVDAALNTGKGSDINYTGKVSVFDVTEITDDAFVTIGFTLVYQVFVGISIVIAFIIILSLIILAKRSVFG